MLRSADEPHAVRVSPVSMPARLAMIEPVTRTPLRNLRVTPNVADSSCDTAWFASARRSCVSRDTDRLEASRPEKMLRNASSSRSIASAVR